MSRGPALFWFRRDLRLADNRALLAALESAGVSGVVPFFCADETLLRGAGPTRVGFLAETLASLDSLLGGALVVRYGDPRVVLPALVNELGVTEVFATEEFTPAARDRDARVAQLLGDVPLRLIDSPYIVRPGSVFSQSHEPYKVFTPFRRVWDTFEIPEPLAPPSTPQWVSASTESLARMVELAGRAWPEYFGDIVELAPAPTPAAGERAAAQMLAEFAPRVDQYGTDRNIPSVPGTSQLSPHLRFGSIHPRQVVHSVLGDSDDRRVFVSEIAWREFYADVLFHHPHSSYDVLQPTMNHLPVDTDAKARERFRAWARGETGYPLVDAGMRQLLDTGWMHNRVRMVAASFLVKHLHLDWRWGAKWFMWRLLDGDVASNQHGWQWAAGTGTDAAPYHRVFNPTLQAERFDPDGAFVHQFIPELSGVAAPQCLQPGGGDGLLAPPNYVRPIIDAKTERDEALRRFALARETAANRG